MAERHAFRFARTLAVVYAALVVYASLHPLTGWRASGVDVFDFLVSPWPRYFTWFDIAVNVGAYVPLGFLLVPALRSKTKPGWAVVLAALSGVLLSVGLEALQNYLPSRVPSNVDWGCNSAGALIGALSGARWGGAFADHGWLARWRRRRIVRGRRGDLGLVLMAAWVLTQLSTSGMFLGSGDLRGLFGLASPIDYTAHGFLMLEMAMAACGVIAAGLVSRQSLREPSPWMTGLLFLLAAAARSLSAALQIGVEDGLSWLTPGTIDGFVAGTLLLVLALRSPPWLQRVLASLALLAGTVLVNLAPANPYAAATPGAWQAGQFLNFNGLTHVMSMIWPFAALAFLVTQPAASERSSR